MLGGACPPEAAGSPVANPGCSLAGLPALASVLVIKRPKQHTPRHANNIFLSIMQQNNLFYSCLEHDI
jgi:hypothetical protein